MAPRPIWSGTISFGLVSIPVRMVTATSSRELRFHFVDRHDLQPVGYDKVRKDSGERVDPDDVVRAFEIEKGRFVPVEPEDLDRLDVERTRSPAEVAGDVAEADGLRKAEVEMAKSLVENLSAEFDPERYDDSYRKELLDLIRQKAEGVPLPEPQDEGDGEVVDLMQALRESVERTQRARSKKAS